MFISTLERADTLSLSVLERVKDRKRKSLSPNSAIRVRHSLAELEKDLLEDQDRPSAAQDDERLATKQ